MRIAWAGTARFAVLVLSKVAASPHEIVVCLTTPDRPRGRHGAPQPSVLKEAALELGVPVVQPDDLRAPEARADLLAFTPDVLVACAYGRIVPPELFTALPSLVVHPSLVPHWRGAAPVVRALMAGETRLGVSTIAMAPGIDEGPIADEREVTVPSDADAGAAYELLAGPAADSLLATLAAMADGSLAYTPQRGDADYAAKITEADRVVDWRRPAAADRRPGAGAVSRRGRAHRARRPARAALEGHAARRPARRRSRARPADRAHRPTATLEILELQEAGRKRMTRPRVPARRRPAPGAGLELT